MQAPPKKKRARRWLWLYLLVWLFTVVMFSGVIFMQVSDYNNFRQELARSEAELENETQIQEDLRDEMVYNDSDAYIEKIAREQLGLVKPDEILFVNEAE